MTPRSPAPELLPCPFCGGKLQVCQEPHDNGYVAGLYYVYHASVTPEPQKCRLRIREHFESLEQIYEFWNTRTPPPAACAAGGGIDRLVSRFADALREKLHAAEKKYGHSDGWQKDNWRSDLIDNLLHHLEKGDPRDVAAYCAFAWHHGWSVTPPTMHQLPSSPRTFRHRRQQKAAEPPK